MKLIEIFVRIFVALYQQTLLKRALKRATIIYESTQTSNTVSIFSFILAGDLRNEFYTVPRREKSCAERASVLCPSLHKQTAPHGANLVSNRVTCFQGRSSTRESRKRHAFMRRGGRERE